MWAKAEGTGTILTNAIGRCPARLLLLWGVLKACAVTYEEHMPDLLLPYRSSILVHLHDEKLR